MLLTEYIKNQETPTRVTNFKDFASKKRLTEANLFTEEQMKQIGEIRNAISFSVHNDKKYLIASIYDRSKTYKFLVINTEDMTVEELPTIKTANSMFLRLSKRKQAKSSPKRTKKKSPRAPRTEKSRKAFRPQVISFLADNPQQTLTITTTERKRVSGLRSSYPPGLGQSHAARYCVQL
jgi:hypothetical protein